MTVYLLSIAALSDEGRADLDAYDALRNTDAFSSLEAAQIDAQGGTDANLSWVQNSPTEWEANDAENDRLWLIRLVEVG